MNGSKGFGLFTILLLTFTFASWGSVGAANDPLKILSLQNPIMVDKDSNTVSFLADVNAKYFFNSTRHAVVFKGGKFGDKAVFRGFTTPRDFHEALLSIGAKPGENMTMDNKESTTVKGDALDVTVTWEGANKTYTLDEVIKDSNHKPIDVHFGGNLPVSLANNTGCLICLDSCPVGICSNATYTYGAVEGRNEVSFMGRKDILPADATVVVITVKRKG